jgi:hypothetical protein
MTTYESMDAVVRKMQRYVDLGQGDVEVTFKMPVNTTLGANAVPEQLVLQARIIGLQASVYTAGGWFSKTHLVEVQGATETALRWLRWTQTVINR